MLGLGVGGEFGSTSGLCYADSVWVLFLQKKNKMKQHVHVIYSHWYAAPFIAPFLLLRVYLTLAPGSKKYWYC